MKKIVFTIFAVLALTGASYAGSFSIGVSGSIAQVSADGTETTDAGSVGGGAGSRHHDGDACGACARDGARIGSHPL